MARKKRLKSLDTMFKDVLENNKFLLESINNEEKSRLLFYNGFNECLNTLRNTGNVDEEVLGAYVDELESELNNYLTKT